MMSIVKMDGELYTCRSMPRMPLISSIDLQLYGMLEFIGPDANVSYLTPIEVMHHSFLQGSSDIILSKEGVAQSDPLSKLMNAATLMPLTYRSGQVDPELVRRRFSLHCETFKLESLVPEIM